MRRHKILDRIYRRRHGVLLGVLVLSLCYLVGCQSIFYQVPDTKAYISQDRDEKWINDIAYLEKVLPEAHKNLYFSQDETYFKGKLEALKEKVPEYTDSQINIAMSEIVASMGDTHTNLNIGVDKIYPIQLYWYDEGIYIVDTTEEYKQLIYSKVISLNGKSMEEVAKAFKPLFTGANDQWFKNQVMYYVTSEELLKYFEVIDQDEITLQLEMQDGTKKEVSMKPVSYETFKPIEDEKIYKVPLYKQHKGEKYWYEYFPNEKILYVNYNSASEMFEKPFKIFTDEVFKALSEEEVEKLVIDIRANQGGSDRVFSPFLKKLKKSKWNHSDQLFVVMGRKTYSAGLNTVINLKKQTNATIIGENSGGQPNHYGDTRHFKLPNSKINVSYSTEYFKKWDEDVESLAPDVPIGVQFELEKQGKDSVMEWVKNQS